MTGRKIEKQMDMRFATEMSGRRVRGWLQQAELVTLDQLSKKRREQQECKACYYGPKMGGQAITESECSCCGTTMTFASTNTDILCLSCAKDHRLCKHCGGDINMNSRRREWPDFYREKSDD